MAGGTPQAQSPFRSQSAVGRTAFRCTKFPPPGKLHFLPGPSLPLRYWHSIAVDPHLIPLGSRVFVSALCNTPSRGWFVAADTGGTVISGHHIDVYRPPPATPDAGEMLTAQRIFVMPSMFRGRVRAPACP